MKSRIAPNNYCNSYNSQDEHFHVIHVQVRCHGWNFTFGGPMPDFLDFTLYIHQLKSKLMKKMNIKQQNFFVFQHRSGDYDSKRKGKDLLKNFCI